MTSVHLLAVDGIGEVGPGDDLAALVVGAVADADPAVAPRPSLLDGDILIVTSKVVSKAEDRAAAGAREDLLGSETDRVVARRGRTRIVRTRHGLVLAGAGIDASNVAAGTVLLLPRDPDASARRLREQVRELTGRNVAVVVSDTAGRAWRDGQTDIAIGAAGLAVLHEYAGRSDSYGNELAVTAPAVADEIAAAGDLVKGKLGARPVAILRGLADLVLPAGEHGPGAAALVRDEAHDMFGLGSREAVLTAVTGAPDGHRGFGASVSADELVELLDPLVDERAGAAVVDGTAVDVPLPTVEPRALGRLEARLCVAAYALGWEPGPNAEPGTSLRFVPRSP